MSLLLSPLSSTPPSSPSYCRRNADVRSWVDYFEDFGESWQKYHEEDGEHAFRHEYAGAFARGGVGGATRGWSEGCWLGCRPRRR